MRRITYRGKSKVIIRLCELINDLYDRTLGDMVKEVYDTNDNGIVDNSELVNGHEVHKDVPADAKFTDTIYDDTLIRDRVNYIANSVDLLMTTLFDAEYMYLIDSQGHVILDADGYPIYTARFVSKMGDLATLAAAVKELQSRKYLYWANPENTEEESQHG